MIQSPRKSTLPVVSYSDGALATQLLKLRTQREKVRLWAERGQWRESGSDGLFQILEEV